MGLKPEETIRDYLAATVTELVAGTSVFSGPVTSDPDKGVWVIPSGGPAPTRFLGETQVQKHYGIQIRTRGNKEDFDGGLTLARSVSDAMHIAIHDKITFGAYLDIEVLNSQPIPIGEDDKGLPEWSQNFEAQFKE